MTRDGIIKFMEYLKEEIPKAGCVDREQPTRHCSQCSFVRFEAQGDNEKGVWYCSWCASPASDWNGNILRGISSLAQMRYSEQCVFLRHDALAILRTYKYLQNVLHTEKFNDTK